MKLKELLEITDFMTDLIITVHELKDGYAVDSYQGHIHTIPYDFMGAWSNAEVDYIGFDDTRQYLKIKTYSDMEDTQ